MRNHRGRVPGVPRRTWSFFSHQRFSRLSCAQHAQRFRVTRQAWRRSPRRFQSGDQRAKSEITVYSNLKFKLSFNVYSMYIRTLSLPSSPFFWPILWLFCANTYSDTFLIFWDILTCLLTNLSNLWQVLLRIHRDIHPDILRYILTYLLTYFLTYTLTVSLIYIYIYLHTYILYLSVSLGADVCLKSTEFRAGLWLQSAALFRCIQNIDITCVLWHFCAYLRRCQKSTFGACLKDILRNLQCFKPSTKNLNKPEDFERTPK